MNENTNQLLVNKYNTTVHRKLKSEQQEVHHKWE